MDKERLKSYVERLQALKSEAKSVRDDIRDLKCEMKGAGFNPKAVETVVKLLDMNAADRDDQDNLIETYRMALGI